MLKVISERNFSVQLFQKTNKIEVGQIKKIKEQYHANAIFLIWPILEARAKILCWFFGKFKRPKCISETNWPLSKIKLKHAGNIFYKRTCRYLLLGSYFMYWSYKYCNPYFLDCMVNFFILRKKVPPNFIFQLIFVETWYTWMIHIFEIEGKYVYTVHTIWT